MSPRRAKSTEPNAEKFRRALIAAVQKEVSLHKGSSSIKVKAASWRTVAKTCGESVEACMEAWDKILLEHKQEYRAQAGSTGSGSSDQKSLCDNYEELIFLREGTAQRRTVSSSTSSIPFREDLAFLSPPRPSQRGRTPSETLNDSLVDCIDSVRKTLSRPTSVEYTLGVAIGERLNELPDGDLKWELRTKATNLLTEIEKELNRMKLPKD